MIMGIYIHICYDAVWCVMLLMCCSLTHGLVFGGDGGGMMEDENVSLKLPAGHGVLAGCQHHHPLPDLVPPHLINHITHVIQ